MLLLATAVLSGCATVFTGDTNDPTPASYQSVRVTTDPPGADCASGSLSIKSPGNLKLLRRASHTIVCRRAGYEPFTAFVGSRQSGLLWLDLIMPLGLIVDFADGAAFTLTPKELRLPLHKLE